MAFVHCHGCDWSQDDFWDFSFSKYAYWLKWNYNPISVFMSYVFTRRGYWKPRRIRHDKWCAEENGWRRRDPHSWRLTWFQFKRIFRKVFYQKWWTESGWRLAIKKNGGNWPLCPSCEGSLCID